MFLTLDFDYADRILPSLCRISIREWTDFEITKVYDYLINPECDIEDFFSSRHELHNDDVKDAPILSKVWEEISLILKNNLVFVFFGSKEIETLIKRLNIDYLTFPNIRYASVQSLCKRTMDLRFNNINTMAEYFKITDKKYNAAQDSETLGVIIKIICDSLGVYDINILYNSFGFSGGFVSYGKKYCYRSIKNKKNKTFDMKISILINDLEQKKIEFVI